MNSNSVPDELERRLTQALASTSVVIAFERDYLEENSAHYSEDIVQFCERLGRPLHHCQASEYSEASMAQQLVTHDSESGVLNAVEGTSLYRAICASLEQRASGIFCIYDVEELSREGVQLLSRLIHFIRDRSLRWQFLLIGEISHMPALSLGMLHIDLRFPELEEVEPKPAPPPPEPKARPRRFPWQLGLSLVLLLALSAYWLLANFGPDSPVAESRQNARSEIKQTGDEKKKPNPLSRPRRTAAPVVAMSEALEQALQLASLGRIKRLIAEGSSVNSINDNGETGLIMAAQASDGNLVKELIALGARLDMADTHGHTALFYACLENKSQIVADLLAAGANANTHSELLKTPLIIAARNGNTRISQYLLSHGADPNWQDQLGWSPMFYAAWSNQEKLASILVEAGAQLELIDNDGYTAIDIARIRKSKEVTELLSRVQRNG